MSKNFYCFRFLDISYPYQAANWCSHKKSPWDCQLSTSLCLVAIQCVSRQTCSWNWSVVWVAVRLVDTLSISLSFFSLFFLWPEFNAVLKDVVEGLVRNSLSPYHPSCFICLLLSVHIFTILTSWAETLCNIPEKIGGENKKESRLNWLWILWDQWKFESIIWDPQKKKNLTGF